MPELAEVERGRKLAERVARGRRIARARVENDPIVFEGKRPATLRRALEGARVERVERKGKYLFFALDRRPWPIFHYGMTGAFRTPEDEPVRLQAHGREVDRAWPPRFTKIHLHLDDGGELVMTNARRLGRVLLRDDPLAERPMSRLGFDPLRDLPTPTRFEALVRPRRVTLKGLLLDQGFAAGVGNWIADEVLYQARLDPRRKADSLSTEEIRRMHAALGRIVRKAVAVDADKDRFPRTWLFHDRWDRKQDARTAKGERIVHLTLAGRTTAWVPSVQS